MIRLNIELELRKRFKEKIHSVWTPLPGPQTLAMNSPADIIFFGGSAGGGKGMWINTLIPTPLGFKLMDQMAVGDQVFDENGNICNVTYVSETNHRRVFKIIFEDGNILFADDIHRWKTLTDQERTQNKRFTVEFREKRKKIRPSRAVEKSKKPGVSKNVTLRNQQREHIYKDPISGNIRSTLEIFETLKVRSHRINHSVDICKPIDLPEASLEVDPYTLGAYLGDGCSSNGYIGKLGTDMDEIISYIPYEVERITTYDNKKYKHPFKLIKFKDLKYDLKKINVINNKHIPMMYLRSSIEQRKELLRGILDTDGHASEKGNIELSLSNKKLADDVLHLVNSLGIKATQKVKKTTCNDSYRIHFMADFPCFKLKRKLAKQKLDNHRDTNKRRYIIDVQEVNSIPTKCIAVDSPSHMYLAGESFIPTHNTDALLGIALQNHQNSIIFRRETTQFKGMIRRSHKIYKPAGGRYNKVHKFWEFKNGKMIEFGGVRSDDDKEKHQGIPHDFIGVDEITHFTEDVFKFLLGWLRDDNPNQRKRVICTGNPPTNARGRWVIKYWAAWLDPKHPNPALPGELRYYATINGVETECVDGTPFDLNGYKVTPKSRTFIPARVEDNPYLMETGYRDQLEALPEPLRSQMLLGDFTSGMEDSDYQTIPTDWIRLAQKRWLSTPKPAIEMSSLGIDVARSGNDKTILSPRYGTWFDKQIVLPGKDTPDGDSIAAAVIKLTQPDTIINIDVIGIGASAYDSTAKVRANTVAVNSASKSIETDRSKKLTFTNLRAEMWWKLREALDPVKGDNLCLPDDPELLADLTSSTYTLAPTGIRIQSKEEIKKEIGRSPDKGDSLIYAFYMKKVILGNIRFI